MMIVETSSQLLQMPICHIAFFMMFCDKAEGDRRLPIVVFTKNMAVHRNGDFMSCESGYISATL